MFFVPIIYLSGVLIVWILVAITDRRTTRQMVGTRWSTSLCEGFLCWRTGGQKV